MNSRLAKMTEKLDLDAFVDLYIELTKPSSSFVCKSEKLAIALIDLGWTRFGCNIDALAQFEETAREMGYSRHSVAGKAVSA
jgi:hypothetical protein